MHIKIMHAVLETLDFPELIYYINCRLYTEYGSPTVYNLVIYTSEIFTQNANSCKYIYICVHYVLNRAASANRLITIHV